MRHLLPAILLALLPLTGAAQALSLAEAEALWRENSREVALARAAVAGAEADVVAAGQIPNPGFSLNVSQVSPQSGVGAGPLKDKRMDSVFQINQLVERGDKTAAAPLAAMVREGRSFQARLHALYTLEGLGLLDPASAEHALGDPHFAVRMHAVALAERWLNERPAMADKVLKLAGDKHARVRLQVALTLGPLSLGPEVVDLGLDVADPVEALLLRLPASFQTA